MDLPTDTLEEKLARQDDALARPDVVPSDTTAPLCDPVFSDERQQAEEARQARQAVQAARKPVSIYLALPTGGMFHTAAMPGVEMATRHRIYKAPTTGEAGVCNALWCNALNLREQLQLTHYCMWHSDVQVPPLALDCMIERMDAVGADVIAAVISIKDGRGITSTAVRNNKTRAIRRLTRKEVARLPDTFSLRDIPWADPDEDALLLNNGLVVCRFDQEWVENVTFRFIEWIVRRPDGQFMAGFFSEDWDFSEQCTVMGLKLFATKIPTAHWGTRTYNALEPEAADWDEDQGDQPRV